MNGVKIENWWIGMVVAGIAVTGAAKLTSDPKAVVAVGIGLVCIGIGEWISRPTQERIFGSMAAHWKVTGNPRIFSPLGLMFTAPGVVLFLLGLGRIAVSLLK